jgi:hypothetical protein
MWFFRHDPSPIPLSGLTLAVTLAFFVWPSLPRAQPLDPRQAALDDLVAARMLATKCPSWQLNPAEAQRRFSELDLKPTDWQDGGRYAKFFDDRLNYYPSLLSRMSEQRACAAAEAAFGPSGRVRRGWMKPQ